VSAKLIRMTRDKRMEKDLLPAGGKESTEVIPKAVPFWNKGRMGILFGAPAHIHTGEQLEGGGAHS
jgi:hypothetical protein